MNRKFKFVIPCLIFLWLGLAITGYTEKTTPVQVITDMLPKDQGSVTIDGLSMCEYVKRIPIHEISAQKTVYLEGKQEVDITDLEMSLQTEKGEQAKLSGGIAKFNVSTKIGEIRNQVKYRTQSGDILTCTLLLWDMNKDQIIVPGNFTITREKQTLTASDLTTDRNLNQGSMSNIRVIGK